MNKLEEKRFNAGSCLAHCCRKDGFRTCMNLKSLTEKWSNKFGDRLLEITQTMESPNLVNRGGWWDGYRTQIGEIQELLESELKKKVSQQKKAILRDLRDGLKEHIDIMDASGKGEPYDPARPFDVYSLVSPKGGRRDR